MELLFNKNIIKLGDDEEYINKTINAIAILYIKQKYNYKDNVLVYFKTSLNWTTKIKLTKIIKLLYS